MNELRIERRFKADPATVFAFVTESTHLLQWWGPEAVTIPEHLLDFTKPGNWSSVMMNDDGKRYKVSGEVLAVDEPNSVEFTWAWHDQDDIRGHESRVVFQVSPANGGGTDFVLIHSGLASEEIVQNHNSGWTSSLIKLEKLTNNTNPTGV